jgi:hypothetical protein
MWQTVHSGNAMTSSTEQMSGIDRREAIRRVSALLGSAALIGGSAIVQACQTERKATVKPAGTFTASDVAFLDEIADTILPTTKTPGAKAALVGSFMTVMVTDCYEEKDQKIFREGMQKVDAACQAAHQTSFMKASPEQRLALLEALDKEQKTYQDAKKADDPNHYFRMMKELTLLGYFTSEIGMTQAMRYRETPGRFDPCVPYQKGETSWAGHA